MAITRQDVAKKAHVSTATVSNVVNGRGAVGPKVRQRVQEVIKELGYQPNQIARSLKTNRTNELALFSSDIMNPYYAEVACGVEEYAREHGYLVCIVTTDMMEKHKLSFFNRQFDGIIIQSIHISVSDIARLTDRQIPIVLISGSESWNGLPSPVTQLTIEIKTGTRNLFNYILKMGHRRIVFIGAQKLDKTRTNDTRLEAYQEILTEHNIPIDPALIYMEDLTPDRIYQYIQSILCIAEPPTAIFTGNDNYALPVLAAIHDMGLSVPADVSVVGFDNILPAAYYYPPLTTIGIPKYSLGRTAAELLLQKIQGETVEDQNIKTELIIRESVAPHNRKA
jgi:DNA-binding LacI/PurR family transcriptional regulator